MGMGVTFFCHAFQNRRYEFFSRCFPSRKKKRESNCFLCVNFFCLFMGDIYTAPHAFSLLLICGYYLHSAAGHFFVLFMGGIYTTSQAFYLFFWLVHGRYLHSAAVENVFAYLWAAFTHRCMPFFCTYLWVIFTHCRRRDFSLLIYNFSKMWSPTKKCFAPPPL